MSAASAAVPSVRSCRMMRRVYSASTEASIEASTAARAAASVAAIRPNRARGPVEH